MKEKIKSFFAQCARVWHILRKPTGQEFKLVSKISAIGLLALGLIGFLISIIMKLFS
jgi:protein transport protein SEC61 subunit gamma-like protein